jgi:peroxiredoxin Q/BCP
MTDSKPLSMGSIAPDFTLPASTGKQVSLADFRDQKNVYLFFIREYN